MRTAEELEALIVSDLAGQLFNAYNEEGPNPWKTFDGRDVPRWHELNDQVRGKWIAAARRARELLSGSWSPVGGGA